MSVPSVRRQVEDFLGSNGLRLGEVDLYLAVLSEDGAILAGGGLQRDIVKCLAVSAEARSLGLSVPLVSRLISEASERGYTNVKVFTKPENRALFESLGFKLLAEAPKAILLENGRGLADYCQYLRAYAASGVMIMNANPFTLGHRYLVEQAALALGPSAGSGTVLGMSVALPAFTLAIAMSAKYLRQVRATVLDELSKDYVLGAKARGVPFSTTMMKSVMKASLVTIITLLTLSIGSLLGGTAIVESIFMWDGVGKMAVDAINMRDYPIIQAYVMWMAIIYVLVNLITDLSYRYLDPRIRLGGIEQ